MAVIKRLKLKRAAQEFYLGARLIYARWKVGQRQGARDFSRVRIVGAMKWHHGISAGAALQYQAMRRLGLDVELLDASDAINNPFRRIEHEPGSAYIFHSGGPQNASHAVQRSAPRGTRVSHRLLGLGAAATAGSMAEMRRHRIRNLDAQRFRATKPDAAVSSADSRRSAFCAAAGDEAARAGSAVHGSDLGGQPFELRAQEPGGCRRGVPSRLRRRPFRSSRC